MNPYTRLKNIGIKFCDEIKYRHTKVMWLYPKARLGERWSLVDLYERTSAAKQLGYDVVLSADDDGLRVKYVKAIPETPWEFR